MFCGKRKLRAKSRIGAPPTRVRRHPLGTTALLKERNSPQPVTQRRSHSPPIGAGTVEILYNMRRAPLDGHWRPNRQSFGIPLFYSQFHRQRGSGIRYPYTPASS